MYSQKRPLGRALQRLGQWRTLRAHLSCRWQQCVALESMIVLSCRLRGSKCLQWTYAAHWVGRGEGTAFFTPVAVWRLTKRFWSLHAIEGVKGALQLELACASTHVVHSCCQTYTLYSCDEEDNLNASPLASYASCSAFSHLALGWDSRCSAIPLICMLLHVVHTGNPITTSHCADFTQPPTDLIESYT